MIEAKILLDSVGVNESAPRLTTWLLTIPRFILAELNTHRMLSRNCPSSRAIPVEKRIQMVLTEPVIPIEWGMNSPNMQSHELATPEVADQAQYIWILASQSAVKYAEALVQLGIHKQIANRLLEPFVTVTVLATSVQKGWENFFALRAHSDADPHIQALAYQMLEKYNNSTPKILQRGEVHIPFGDDMPEGLTKQEITKVAVARAARVSYNNFDDTRNIQADFKLHDRLVEQGHWSSFEHIAMVPQQGDLLDLLLSVNSGNLIGWCQLRKGYENECRKDLRVKPVNSTIVLFEDRDEQENNDSN